MHSKPLPLLKQSNDRLQAEQAPVVQVLDMQSLPIEQVQPSAMSGDMAQAPVVHAPPVHVYPLPRTEQSVAMLQGAQMLPVHRPLWQSEFIEHVSPFVYGGIPEVVQDPALHS